MARLRIFIAVDLGDTIRQRTIALQEKLACIAPGMKWVEHDNLHVTLLFLGEVEKREVVSVCKIVRDQARAIPPFNVELSGLGAFPTPRRPKILWAGITEGAEELKKVHDRLEEPLLELGCYRREDRGYTPHLTLGRLSQEDREADWGPIFAKHADWNGGVAAIDEILVMCSELRRDGPVYTVMGRGRLGGKVVELEEEDDE